jgi:acetoin utilization deacetylase AcuC-like enzyme
MQVTDRGFAAMCSAMAELADGACGGKLVLVLEGGYDLAALATSVRACLEVLGGRRESFPTGAGSTAPRAVAAARAALEAAQRPLPAS